MSKVLNAVCSNQPTQLTITTMGSLIVMSKPFQISLLFTLSNLRTTNQSNMFSQYTQNLLVSQFTLNQ